MEIFQYTNSIIFSSVTYIVYVSDSETVWMIDCGDIDEAVRWIKENNKKLAGVFLTHTHFDHIYGLNRLKQIYPKCKVYASSYGIQGLYDPRLNMSYYHEDIDAYIFEHNDVQELTEATTIELWPDAVLTVLETPGHDPSCLTYIVDNAIFTGDSYIPGIKVITNFPKSNKKDAEKSLEKILQMKEKDSLTVYCGHTINEL